MKKVLKFVKGKKDERKDSGGITPSQSGDLISPAQTPEDEKFLGLDNSSGYIVDFSGKDKTLTKLHKAAWQGNLEKLKSALKKVDIDAVDKRNRTALHFAVAQGHPNIVWFLLGNNAKTSICDDEGHTPLLKAVECGHKECMNLLLDRGSDVNVTDYTGNSALHIAVSQASVDTVILLLKKGADTEISNNAGDYPLHIATRLENKDLVDLLLDAGASVEVLDRENRTPLMLSAKSGNYLLVQLFIEKGTQLTAVDSNGWTAQDYAMLGGHESIATSLKSFSRKGEKKTENRSGELDLVSNNSSGSWNDSQTERSQKEPIAEKFKILFEKSSEKETDSGEKEKNEDFPESPDVEAIPPFCQPPRSWEMIQAGMIDENKNGNETKRRSITTLGTLRSRRESFTEGSSSPQFTLSLNRRKTAKANNAFAKQRFSFNEEESLKYWLSEEKAIRKDLEKIELENMLNLEELAGPKNLKSPPESDWDSLSVKNLQESEKVRPNSGESDSSQSHITGSKSSGNETLGREGTMQGTEEIWVVNPKMISVHRSEERQPNSWDSEEGSVEKEENFPPPPTALELGVDIAKSIKYMKGTSMDQPTECATDRNRWKNFYGTHSLDRLEERDFVETSKGKSDSVRKIEEVIKCQKPRDRFTDVSRRINEQLECYDQALRELAETTRNSDKPPTQNYYSLPSAKTVVGGDYRRTNSQELAPNADSPFTNNTGTHPLLLCGVGVENNERLGSEAVPEKLPQTNTGEKLERKTKRHILLAMRDVKHAVHLANTFKTSIDDQILSPLARPEDSFDMEDKSNSKPVSGSSEGNSPPDENPFFGIGRQETVLEGGEIRRKSSSSGTGEESTLWLQDDAGKKGVQSPVSDDEVPEILADEGSQHKRSSSFSPLGVIQREMEEESQEWGSERRPAASVSVYVRGENEDQSPDISLSSGPIEPIGAEKDSGSEPESSHNDASPVHNYTLKSQHEWLKSHLKAATSEKNKLEELTAQLAEKAERLQYELADAKEASKSRDEVIQLLQSQLARMEAAYTKSLEESVQSRLQLTSHEQEILHLKELCYKYEEEKEVSAPGEFQDLQLRIKALEEEKEKMKREIIRLEEEKSFLEKRVKPDKKEEEEMIEQCQRWKERSRKLEEAVKARDAEQVAYESFVKDKDRDLQAQENSLKEQNFELEKKYLELSDENIELRSKATSLAAELDMERRKTSAKDETLEPVAELKRKNLELETRLKKLEKEMEEKMLKKLKEKEEEVGGLVMQFNRERDALIASYEKKLTERRSEGVLDLDDYKKENQKLRHEMKNLQDQVSQLQITSKNEFRSLDDLTAENLKLRQKIIELEEKPREGNAEIKSEVQELKNQVDSLRKLLGPRKNLEKIFNPKPEGRRRGVGKDDELAWSNLYGMKATRRRGGRSTSVTETLLKSAESSDEFYESKKLKPSEENILNRLNAVAEQQAEASQNMEKLEFLELKKEILSLQSKMSDEKNLRHALENQMIKLNLDLSEKENLEKEMNSLKRKVDRDCLRRSEMELIEYQRHLEAKREKYLGVEEVEKPPDEGFKTKCEILAKEREKSKEIRNYFGRRTKSFDCPSTEAATRSQPQLVFQHRILALDAEMKTKLETELDKSIRKYVGECSSAPSITNVQRELVKKKYF